MSENENALNENELDEASGGALYDNYFTYRVKAGDTLLGICNYYGYPLQQIATLNNIPYPYIIHINQSLLIPKRK